MRKVFTVGVFDYFHYGHLRLFCKAKTYGDYLIVAVQDENYILKFKPDSTICYSTEQRKEIISALKIVDEVYTYESVDKIVPEIDFDVFVLGEDQLHEGFKRAAEWCRKNGREVVRVERTPGISSSDIKHNIIKRQ